MDPFRLITRSDSALLMEDLVDHWEQRLRERLAEPAPQPMGLATGRTMDPFYRLLVQRLRSWPQKDFERLRQGWLSFNLDEYVGLPAAAETSFAATMRRHLGEPLALRSDQLRLPDGAASDPEAEAERYASALQMAGGLGIQLLGLGINGHVGFNEPPCSDAVRCRVVQLSDATRRQNAEDFATDPQGVPPQAITIGLGEILEAGEVHLVVTGAAKAAILQKVLCAEPTPAVPASWLRQHPRLWVWADAEALALVRATAMPEAPQEVPGLY